jgi:hypothetical protein
MFEVAKTLLYFGAFGAVFGELELLVGFSCEFVRRFRVEMRREMETEKGQRQRERRTSAPTELKRTIRIMQRNTHSIVDLLVYPIGLSGGHACGGPYSLSGRCSLPLLVHVSLQEFVGV